MLFPFLTTLALALAVIPQSGDGEDADLVLVRNGRARGVIVVADAPSSIEREAAVTLARYLLSVTGGGFRVVTQSEAPETAVRILVGPSRAATSLLGGFDWSKLGRDGILIRRVENSLIVAGGKPRGTRNAVMTLLEDVLGVRWWTASETSVPERGSLVISDLDVLYVPPFEYRQMYCEVAFGKRLRLNGNELPWESRALSEIVPARLYFDDHTEWFGVLPETGERVRGKRYCLTNPSLVRFVAEDVSNRLRPQYPATTLADITLADDEVTLCGCAGCATAREGGGSSALLIRFVNSVAELVERELPATRLRTLAHRRTVQPPTSVKVRSNVIIELAYTGRKQTVSLPDDGDARALYEGWSRVTAAATLWSRQRAANLRNLVLPHPTLHTLGPGARYLAESGVRGVFFQNDPTCTVGHMRRLRTWVIGHLLWDPTLDENMLVTSFLEGYYGPAASLLGAYLSLLEQTAVSSGAWVGVQDLDTTRWLNLRTLNRATALLDQAEEIVLGHPDFLERVQRARLGIDFVWLNRHQEFLRESRASGRPFLGPEDLQAAAGEWIRAVRAFGATRYAERDGAIDDLAQEFDKRFDLKQRTPSTDGLYEAETGIGFRTRRRSDLPGFTGEGYVSFQNASRDFVQWNVRERSIGECTVVLRCAHMGRPRPMALLLNGKLLTTLFRDTAPAEFGGWEEIELDARLGLGVNTVRAVCVGEAAVGDSLVFLDSLQVIAR